MAYQSLYRRYRSQRFDEVLGQDHLTGALRNAVRESRVAQGYLFSGPRGTGKTSTARILAKVLNCEHPVDGEPDTTCANCVSVQENRTVDWLVELDAASNNGVDAMRDLLGRVAMGTSGNRKVYILDEVHMLSAAASNALLKTLEEPPDHIVFVLATTEPEKVLPTIRSRTQHFEFNLLPADVLADHVRHVIADAELGLGEDAVEHVVAAGKGSARDTLSALDQVAAAGGVTDTATPIDDIVDAMSTRDTGAALVAVDVAVRSGRDPRVLATALIETLRHAFLVAMGAPAGGLTDTAAARAGDVSTAMGPASLTRALEAIGAAIVEMRHAPDTRIPLEVAIVQVTRPEVSGDLRGVLARLDALEARAAGEAPAPVGASPASPPPAAPSDAPSPEPVPATPVAATAAPPPAGASTPGPATPSAAAPQPAESPAPAGQSPAKGSAAARAKLAERGEAAAPSDARPTPPPGERPSLGGVRRARAAQPAATSPDAPAPPAATPAPAAPTPATPAPAAPTQAAPQAHETPPDTTPTPADPPAASPDLASLTEAWEGEVRDLLKGRAKALFKMGRFVAVDGKRIDFAVPNEAHRVQCQEKVEEVQAVLATRLGLPVRLTLVVDGDGATGDARPGAGQSTATEPEVDEDAVMADEVLSGAVDIDELDDAPDADVGGIAQLQDAFPGAELLEDT